MKFVTIPHNLTSFGINCFYNCDLLKTINLYSSFGDFSSILVNSPVETLNIYTKDQINIISFPNTLKNIKIYSSAEITFTGSIPSEITNIEVYSNIINIISIGENPNIQTIDLLCENEDITIESLSSITTIRFQNPNNIKRFTCKLCESLNPFDFSIFRQLEEIGDNSFQNTQFNSLSFPSSFKRIGFNCFTNCNSLQFLSIQSSMNEIGSLSFSNCEKLESVEIPVSTNFTNIKIDAFENSPIKTITIIGNGELLNQISNQFTLLETISINEGITKIGENVFYELTSLKTLNIPSTVEIVSGGSIQKCYNVNPIISKDNEHITYYEDSFYSISHTKENNENNINNEINNPKTLLSRNSRKDNKIIDIPSDVIIIGEKAFYGDEYVETIIIPESTTSIGKSAFKECPHLRTIEYKGMKDAFLHIDANDLFDYPDELELKVPSEYEDDTLFGIKLNIDENVLNGGEIAGIVIGCLVVVCIVIFLVYWFGIRKRNNQEESTDSNTQEEVL